MQKTLLISQIVVSILLTVSILLQNRGSGLSGTFGGDFSGFYTKRGIEKFLYWATVAFAFIFILLAIANIYVSSRAIV